MNYVQSILFALDIGGISLFFNYVHLDRQPPLDGAVAHRAIKQAGLNVIKRAEQRRLGKSDVGNVVLEVKGDEERKSKNNGEPEVKQAKESKQSPATSTKNNSSDDDDDFEDGFIAMS